MLSSKHILNNLKQLKLNQRKTINPLEIQDEDKIFYELNTSKNLNEGKKKNKSQTLADENDDNLSQQEDENKEKDLEGSDFSLDDENDEEKSNKDEKEEKEEKDEDKKENNLRASKTINKEHVKFQKQSLFNKNNSNKYKGKMSAKINLRFKREEKKKEEKKKEENVVHKKEKKINNEKITQEPELKAPAPDPKEDSNVKVNKKKLSRKILSVKNVVQKKKKKKKKKIIQ